VGGRSFWEASAEFRFKVTDKIGLVPFVDVGAAYEDAVPDFSEEIRIGAGLGIRYHTGLGPIRFDLAMPLVRGDDDPNFAFYVGLGQAF
jgi:translocation and assembly module TamA